MSSRPLRGAPCAVIDFETAGLDAWSVDPLEVAVIHVELGVTAPKVVFRALIKPTGPIPAEATAVHGITDADAAQGREPLDVARDLLSWCRGRTLCAYNLAYDWPFLYRLGKLTAWDVPGFAGGLDAMVWYRKLRGKLSGRLTDACRELEVAFDGEAHAAAADALATAKLMPELLSALARDGHIHRGITLAEMAELTNAWALEQEVTLGDWLRSKGRIENKNWSTCLAGGPGGAA